MAKLHNDYERDRIHLLGMLEDLIWDDLDAMIQLDHYTLNRRNRPDARVTKLLMEMRLLAEDGTLPDATNEAMYEMRTGHRPFWLRKKEGEKDAQQHSDAGNKICKIIDFRAAYTADEEDCE